MADENRMITFEYAKVNYDAFKKQTIPDTKECMTKNEILTYFNVNTTPLASLSANQLVRRDKFVGILSDYSFCARFNGAVKVLAIQSDGKILAGGDFDSYDNITSNRLIRLNIDGTIDSTFNIGNGFVGGVSSIAIQSDGKIIVGGNYTYFNTGTYNNIIRLNPNGSIDNTFSIGTGFAFGGSPLGAKIHQLVIQPSGKILVGGKFSHYNNDYNLHLLRLNANGTKDTTFDSSNVQALVNGSVNAIHLESNGNILVAGDIKSNSLNRLCRLNSNGSLISDAFIENGIVYTLATQSNGKILVGGQFQSSTNIHNNLVRLNTDLSKDTTFFTSSGPDATVRKIIVQPDDKILAVGDFMYYNGTSSNKLMRLTSSGSIDNTFGIGIGFNNSAYDIKLLTNITPNRIIIGGDFVIYYETNRKSEYIQLITMDGNPVSTCGYWPV